GQLGERGWYPAQRDPAGRAQRLVIGDVTRSDLGQLGEVGQRVRVILTEAERQRATLPAPGRVDLAEPGARAGVSALTGAGAFEVVSEHSGERDRDQRGGLGQLPVGLDE